MIAKFRNRFLVTEVEKCSGFFFATRESTKILVIKIAVNNEVAIPINRVVANPLIGPVPNKNKINAVRPVVIFASKMDERAF